MSGAALVGWGHEAALPPVASEPPAPKPAPAAEHAPAVTRGLMVVGLGDEACGDEAVGLHLAQCLAQLPWPMPVTFAQASADLAGEMSHYAHVVVLDAVDGPDLPGALYQCDPERLAERGGSSAGLLTVLPVALRKRVSVFAVHPRTSGRGASMSAEVLAAIPVLLPYLRAYILQAWHRTCQVQ